MAMLGPFTYVSLSVRWTVFALFMADSDVACVLLRVLFSITWFTVVRHVGLFVSVAQVPAALAR